jgi:hypothetical protein
VPPLPATAVELRTTAGAGAYGLQRLGVIVMVVCGNSADEHGAGDDGDPLLCGRHGAAGEQDQENEYDEFVHSPSHLLEAGRLRNYRDVTYHAPATIDLALVRQVPPAGALVPSLAASRVSQVVDLQAINGNLPGMVNLSRDVHREAARDSYATARRPCRRATAHP